MKLLPMKYHHYDELVEELNNINQQWPNLTRIYKLSEKSVLGRDLWVLQISTDANKSRSILKPMVKYAANMHGNEAVGREMLLKLSKYLLNAYERRQDLDVLNLVENTDIHIMPTINPDGFERAKMVQCPGENYNIGRSNENNVDLNRNFPTWNDLDKPMDELYKKVEPETRAVMRWINENPFVLSVNYHDGAVVASYPYDDSHAGNGFRQISPTPDHDLFVHLANIYASNHENMFKGIGLCKSDNFPNGITNGAQWYVVSGGMQDYNYLFSNAFEITLELSCCKYPPEEELPKEWQRNKNSMVKFLQSVHMGIKGIVVDKNNNTVDSAKIFVEGNDKVILTTKHGEYWRLLLPGTYIIWAKAPNGECSLNQHVNVVMDHVKRVDLTINPLLISSPSNGGTTPRTSSSNTTSNCGTTSITSSNITTYNSGTPSTVYRKRSCKILIVCVPMFFIIFI